MPNLNDDEYNDYKSNFRVVYNRYPTPEDYDEVRAMTCADAAEFLGKLEDTAYRRELERDYQNR